MQTNIFVDKKERTGKPHELFGIWMATQIGILGLIYGAIIVSYELSFIQSILAAFVGALSFILVGYLSLSGKIGGTTMFNLSRAVFGVHGNYIPTLCGWINLVGWMCVNVVTATLTLLTLLGILGINTNTFTTIIALIILAILIAISGFLSQESLVKLQSFFTYVFGLMTLIVLGFLLLKTNWDLLFALPSGNWISGFLPAVSIIIAGTGISWAIAAADYSVYQDPKNSDFAIILSTTLAGFIPLFILMSMGILMTSTVPDFLSVPNSIDVIGSQLPTWMTIPYLITALVGLVAPSVISLRSARVNLSTLNIKVNNFTAISIHVIIMLTLGIYVLFISDSFLSIFQSFLGLIGIALAGWSAVFLTDFVLFRKKFGYPEKLLTGENNFNLYNYTGIFSWFLGVFLGFLFTNCVFFDGPFANGIFYNNSLGMLITFISSGIFYIILSKIFNSEAI